VGNGPATFEEMGIPQGKNEGDCVSLFQHPNPPLNKLLLTIPARIRLSCKD
jgi:hypothetical protein